MHAVRCPSCNSDNPRDAKFCDECSAPLIYQCPACGISNRPGAKFCRGCAAPLGSAPARAPTEPHSLVQAHSESISAEPSIDAQGVQGERRNLTLLFCDLVGSTGLAARLDPEDWRELAASYLSAAAQAVERFGGYVAEYLGDGLAAYFGYPQAHDDNPHRAVLAGLAIIEAVGALNRGTANESRPTLAVRIGIDNGPVVVGKSKGKGADVYGESPNIAARVQTVAEPDTVLITAAVHQLVSGLFIVEDRGEHPLKGIERPVRLYRVIQPSGRRGRLAAAAARGLTPFIGREDELRAFLNRWELVREGEGQVILVVGEAGIGKSRLVQRFGEQIAGTPHMWLDCAAAALHQNTPFYTITDMLQQGIRSRGDRNAAERIGILEKSLELAGVRPSDAVPLIAPLMNLPVPARYPPLPMAPEQQRRRLLATIVRWALGTARIQPLVIVIEDLHWADPSTLEAIQLLAEQGPTAPLLLICTSRPEFRAPWPLHAHHAQITLNRLSPRSVREMVARLADRGALASDTVDAVVERSGGVPLFVEELTRSVLEGGGGKQVLHEIPATLHDSLMARLDRLGEAREIAQLASVIGREFSWGLLSAVAATEDEKLEAALRKLADAGVLFVQGIPPHANYRFRHALIQDAAYQTLLRGKRQQYHRQIAQAFERGLVGTAETQPELLAHHYTEADLKEQAIAQWQKAGYDAVQRSANAEAVSHLTKALEILKTLPESPSHAQQELALQITLGVPLMLTKGYAAPEVEKVYSRARELYQQVGESPQVFPMLFGLWEFYSTRAEYKTATELGEQLVSLAQSAQDSALLLEAYTARGNTLSFLGELVLARRHLEQAIALYNPKQHRSHAFAYSQDPGVHSLSFATLALWLLGYPDQARKRSLEALALAQELSHPFSLAFALIHVLYVHRFSWEVKATQERAKELVALSTEHGFPITLAVGAAHQGWALAEQGLGEEGIIQIRKGIETWRATGSTLYYQPFLLAMLAEAQEKGALPEEGLTVLAEALAIVNKTGECFWEAELYRLKGELKLQSEVQVGSEVQDEAEECFRKAIEIAQRQSAKSLELRAVMSLSRLLARQGKKTEARQMLADIYGWFTEGFDTGDLKEARALLKEAF
jgi:predicted ATPase/class 3 adenylate cyclase